MFGIPNPQSLLQPWRNLTHFTEELFAMLKSTAPVEHQGPVTIRVPDGQTALRIEPGGPILPTGQAVLRPRPAPPSSPPAAAPTTARAGFGSARVQPASQEAFARFQPLPPPLPPVQPGLVEPPGRSQPLPPLPPTVGPPPDLPPLPLPSQPLPVAPPAPLPPLATPPIPPPPLVVVAAPVSFTGLEPVRFQTPPQVFDPVKRDYRALGFKSPDLPGTPSPAGGGTTVFIGKVVSGEGDTYLVDLHPEGRNGAVGDRVTVTILEIDSDEVIEPETWLTGIFEFANAAGDPIYECQPPVWMD